MAKRFNSKSACEEAIARSARGNTTALWVGSAAAAADRIESGWYAFCNDTRKLVL